MHNMCLLYALNIVQDMFINVLADGSRPYCIVQLKYGVVSEMNYIHTCLPIVQGPSGPCYIPVRGHKRYLTMDSPDPK